MQISSKKIIIKIDFVKGLWVLAQSVRMQLPAMRWEVIDMEGFQPDLSSSWAMTMVLSLIVSFLFIFIFHRKSRDIHR